MSILDERDEYLKNPYFKEHEYGDYTPFYVAVALCSVLGGFLFILNIAFCWCSRHREYWQNRHTGETADLYSLHWKRIFHERFNSHLRFVSLIGNAKSHVE